MFLKNYVVFIYKLKLISNILQFNQKRKIKEK